MVAKLYHTLRVPTLFVGAVVFGSIIGDLDHILPPQTRSWGHTYLVPGIILFVVVIAYIGRRIRVRVLK